MEVNRLRTLHPEPFLLVTPGIRTLGDDLNDQERTMSPSGALKGGASKIVVGRPITQASDPEKMFEFYCEEMSTA